MKLNIDTLSIIPKTTTLLFYLSNNNTFIPTYIPALNCALKDEKRTASMATIVVFFLPQESLGVEST